MLAFYIQQNVQLFTNDQFHYETEDGLSDKLIKILLKNQSKKIKSFTWHKKSDKHILTKELMVFL
jgi:hypothetical protein